MVEAGHLADTEVEEIRKEVERNGRGSVQFVCKVRSDAGGGVGTSELQPTP